MFNYYKKIIILIEALLNILIVIVFLPRNILFKNRFAPINNKKRVFVLGNGPSIRQDYEKILEKKNDDDALMVVNSFACTQEFEKLKPDYYVLADTAFFINDAQPHILKVQEEVIESIITKTSWNMMILVHSSAKNSQVFSKVKENKNIYVEYINSTPSVGGITRVNNFCYRYGLSNPLFQNALTACLFYCIKLKFRRILLWGADHSWHEGFVMLTNNQLYTKDKHFYDGTEKLIPHINSDGSFIKLHEEFADLQRCFRSYHVIRSYASFENIFISNNSSTSWIDAFERE